MQRENILPLIDSHADSTALAPRDGASGPAALRVGEILVQGQKLSARGLKRALRLQQKKPFGFRLFNKDRAPLRIGEALLKLKLVSEEDLAYALCRQFSYPCLHPRSDSELSQELACAYRPFGAEAEAFRALRTQLLLRRCDDERTTLAVVSPGRREGRSYVAANLAVAFAQMGKRTLLVDADLRRPRQDLIFNLPRHYGLSGVLGMPRDVEELVKVPCLGDLSVVGAGATPPNPLELLSQAQFREWLAAKAAQFEVVILDTPASEVYMDTAVIAAGSAAALMVVRKDHTRLSAVREAADSLAGSRVPIVGTVMNCF